MKLTFMIFMQVLSLQNHYQDQEIIDSLLPIADSFLPGDDSSLLTTPVLGKDTGTNRNKAINPKPWGIDEDF